MNDAENDERDTPTATDRFDVESRVLGAVIAAMQPLDSTARARLLRTVATFYAIGYEIGGRQLAREGEAVTAAVRPEADFSADRRISPKEFLFEKQPVTDVERVTCLAYYLTHYRDQPYFKTLDLSALNTEAAQVKFSNAAYATENATKAGLLAPAMKGQKQITAVGEQLVLALPDRDRARESIAAARPRRRSKRSAGKTSGSKNA